MDGGLDAKSPMHPGRRPSPLSRSVSLLIAGSFIDPNIRVERAVAVAPPINVDSSLSFNSHLHGEPLPYQIRMLHDGEDVGRIIILRDAAPVAAARQGASSSAEKKRIHHMYNRRELVTKTKYSSLQLSIQIATVASICFYRFSV